jgi:23S rRNA pseudouridine1911/1915/1917 synthase
LLSRNNAKALQRIYLAIAAGHPSETGVINAPIGRNPDSIIERMVRADGQPAITHYQVIESLPEASLLKIELLTGRTHQIRVHMKYIGFPLAGDPKYGPRKTLDIGGQALHAGILGFIHPRTEEYLEFEAPLPADFEELLGKLRNNH